MDSSSNSARESLRGDEERIFDLVAGTECWLPFLEGALERAAADGDEGLARKLVDAGAATGTALHHATRSGHGAIVGFLLGVGASTSTKDSNGDTPLHVAARAGTLEIARSLLLHGADQTPWTYVTRHRYTRQHSKGISPW